MAHIRNFKAALNEKVANLTDEEFFLSDAFKDHINTIIEGVTENYGFKKGRVTVSIRKAADKFIAYTDSRVITVNIDSPWINKLPSRAEKYYVIVGIVLHECGHVLYTDFGLMQTCVEKLSHHDIFFPKVDESPELQDALANKWGKYLAPAYKNYDNAVEDGHIEKRIIKHVPGYGECLMKVRDIQRSEATPTYAEALAEAEAKGKKINKIAILNNLILMYAKYGITKIGKLEEPDDLVEVFEEATGYIDSAVASNSAMMRRIEINKMFDCLVKYIIDEIKRKIEEKKSSKSSPSTSAKSTGSEDADADSSDSEASGTSDKETEGEEDEEDSDEESSTKSGKSGDTDDKEDESDDGSEDSDKSEGESDKSEDPADSETDADADGDGTGEADEETTTSESEEGISDEEIEKELREIMEELSEGEEEDLTKHRSSETPLADNDEPADEDTEDKETEDASSIEEDPYAKKTPDKESSDEIDLSYLEKEAAKERLSKELHGSIEKKMAKISDDIRKTRADKCPSVEKYIDPTPTAEEEYAKKHEELDRIARRVVKNLDKIIRERQIGDINRGLYVGKELDAKHAYRRDRKVMANKVLPEDIPDMEVSVLVDCSGSMSWKDRMPRSRECAYVTWKFCQQMGIPCSVYGHTTTHAKGSSCENVYMMCVAHKDNIDDADGKRIFTLDAKSNNRDGWALNFCAEELSKSDCSKKILFVISDGLPAASGYSYNAGKKDLREVVRKYKKKNGISFITAGIDECAPDIKDVYVQGVPEKEAAKFLDFSDMSGLPKAFAKILKKELL